LGMVKLRSDFYSG